MVCLCSENDHRKLRYGHHSSHTSAKSLPQGPCLRRNEQHFQSSFLYAHKRHRAAPFLFCNYQMRNRPSTWATYALIHLTSESDKNKRVSLMDFPPPFQQRLYQNWSSFFDFKDSHLTFATNSDISVSSARYDFFWWRQVLELS